MTSLADGQTDRGATAGTSPRGQEALGVWLRRETEGDRLILRLGGSWTTRTIATINRELEEIAGRSGKTVLLDLSGLKEMDTAGAWLIYRTKRDLVAANAKVVIKGASSGQEALLERIARHDVDCPPAPPPANALVSLILQTGESSCSILANSANLLSFLGLVVTSIVRRLFTPWQLRGTALASHMEQAGFNALPIVGMISFLMGVVLAYLGAAQLERFGAQVFTVNVVAIGVLREMGILLTAIIVAGRSGSAFTAQIGTMKVNEEIDALQTIGLDPTDVLVIPRVLALCLVFPLLTFYADVMGILGGAVMVTSTLDISFTQFVRQLQDAASLNDFWVGLLKAPLFALIIAIVGCFEGLKVSRNAESVGRQTTRSVVESISLIIILDGLLAIFFSIVGI